MVEIFDIGGSGELCSILFLIFSVKNFGRLYLRETWPVPGEKGTKIEPSARAIYLTEETDI